MSGPAETGAVRVAVDVSGSHPDPDGCRVSIDGGQGILLHDGESHTFRQLAEGTHSVRIGDVADNCTVQGGSTRSVSVSGGRTAQVDFAVSCPAPPPETGTIRVTTQTDGTGPASYGVLVDGGSVGTIGPSETKAFTSSTGAHQVALSSLGSCTVTGANPQSVTVTSGGTVNVTFNVGCPELSVRPASLSFSAEVGANPPTQTFTIENTGGGTLSWSASDNQDWLGLSPTSGSVSANDSTRVTVDVASTTLAEGSYDGTVTVTGGGVARTVSVSLTIVPPNGHTLTVVGDGDGNGAVTSNPEGIDCTITAGATSGTCSREFDQGMSVTLTASPGTGSGFTGWSGDRCTGTGVCSVTIDQALTIEASFFDGYHEEETLYEGVQAYQCEGTTCWRVNGTVDRRVESFFPNIEASSPEIDAMLAAIGVPVDRTEDSQEIWDRARVVWEWLHSHSLSGSAADSARAFRSSLPSWPSIQDFAFMFVTWGGHLWDPANGSFQCTCMCRAQHYATLLYKVGVPPNRMAIAEARWKEDYSQHMYIVLQLGARWLFVDPSSTSSVPELPDWPSSVGTGTADYEHPNNLFTLPGSTLPSPMLVR